MGQVVYNATLGRHRRKWNISKWKKNKQLEIRRGCSTHDTVYKDHQSLLNKVNDTLKEHVLRININKTKVIVVSKHHQDIHINCDDKPLQQVL